MPLERTLSIVKPDGVRANLIGEVYRRFENAGLAIVAARMLHLSQREAEAFYAVHRERQLRNWMYKRGVGSFADMTDLARDFRTLLAAQAEVRAPQIISQQRSGDGTRKWLLRADAAQAFEMVFIPEPDRGTLCISSQVGCVLDCSVCATARPGVHRNLSTAGVGAPVLLAVR